MDERKSAREEEKRVGARVREMELCLRYLLMVNIKRISSFLENTDS